MKNNIVRILREIIQGKNVDLYLTVALSFVILWLSLFNITSMNVISITILATLMLIAIANLHSRHVTEELQGALSHLTTGNREFKQWKDVELSELISRSRRVSMLAVANNRFLSENQIQFNDLVKKGGTIRSILINSNGPVLEMATIRSTGASATSDYVRTGIEMSIARLREFAGITKPGSVQLKCINVLPSVIMTWLEFEHDSGLMFLTLTAFKQPTVSRPSFSLSEEKDSKWYQYYREYYENMWNCNEAISVPIDR